MILCYNVGGMIVGFHPISRVKLSFGAAFLLKKNNDSAIIGHPDILFP